MDAKKAKGKKAERIRKYTKHNLIPVFLEAAKLRNKLLKLGFTDNGGAIHSAERILCMLGKALRYPGLSHINNYKKYPEAEFSKAAWKANANGDRVFIEHVAPIRDFTRGAIALVTGQSDAVATVKLERYVKKNFRLVLLTMSETSALNKKNRSKMDSERLKGIPIRRIPKKAKP